MAEWFLYLVFRASDLGWSRTIEQALLPSFLSVLLGGASKGSRANDGGQTCPDGTGQCNF